MAASSEGLHDQQCTSWQEFKIPSKLILTIKLRADGEISTGTFKAHAWVQGVLQKCGIDYSKIYAPVANTAVAQVAVAIVLHLDLDKDHMDFTHMPF